jgi:hypothetical protein
VSLSGAEPTSEPADIADSAAPHPEEMRATVDLTIGRSITIKATARATPAGLVTAALLVVAILIPMIWLTRTRRHGPVSRRLSAG